MIEDLTDVKVCEECKVLNLTTSVGVQGCLRCSKPHCIHFASTIDPLYCGECLGDITLKKETVVKTYTHYNEDTDELTSYNRRAKSISISGNDWLFSQRKISSLNDAELELTCEYHRAYLILLLNEREARRTAYMHRYAGVKITLTPPSATTTSTEVKTTKEIKSTKAAQNAKSIVESMLASGQSTEQLMELLKQMKAKLGGVNAAI